MIQTHEPTDYLQTLQKFFYTSLPSSATKKEKREDFFLCTDIFCLMKLSSLFVLADDDDVNEVHLYMKSYLTWGLYNEGWLSS